MKINRLFEIVYILLDKKRVTANQLSEHFGVSRRTICRDIDILSMAGIPIYTERGSGGGISLLPNFVLNKSILSEHEQNEILSTLHSISTVNPEDSSKTLEKLSTIFNKTANDWLEVDFSEWSNENNFFNELKSAILQHNIVEFNYYNRDGDKNLANVEPKQLWFKSKSWYLKGFCLNKQAMRLYKLSRIKNLVTTDKVFDERDSLIVNGNPILSIYENKPIVDIKLRIEPERAYRVFDDFYENMVEKQQDGSFIVNVSWPEDDWLYGFILSFGEYIEVLEPESIRNIIKNKAEKVLKKYV